MDDRKQLGASLRAAREGAGLTQDQAGERLAKLGVEAKKGAISAWEVGRNVPSSLVLKCLAKIYSVSADELLSGEKATSTNPLLLLGSDMTEMIAKLNEIQAARLKVTIATRVKELLEDAIPPKPDKASEMARSPRKKDK